MTGTWLGIDTTSNTGGVALMDGGELLNEQMLPVRAFHSEKLLPAVSAILESAGIRGSDLSGIGVSRGPGSYTGLRIGTATALGLAMGWNVPVKGVSTLRVLASVFPPGAVLACVRARRGEVFAGVFESSDPLSEELVPQGLYSVDQLMKKLPDQVIFASGSGRSEVPPVPGVLWASPQLDFPRPSAAALCASVSAEAEGFDTGLEPLYLRAFNERI